MRYIFKLIPLHFNSSIFCILNVYINMNVDILLLYMYICVSIIKYICCTLLYIVLYLCYTHPLQLEYMWKKYKKRIQLSVSTNYLYAII